MPVLPLVGSMMVPPGLSAPDFSASSTIDSAMRSLMEPPGLLRSDFTHTLAAGPNRRLMRTWGVLPMACRMLSTFMASPVSGKEGGGSKPALKNKSVRAEPGEAGARRRAPPQTRANGFAGWNGGTTRILNQLFYCLGDMDIPKVSLKADTDRLTAAG